MSLIRFSVLILCFMAFSSVPAKPFKDIPGVLTVDRKLPSIAANSWVLVDPVSGWVIASKDSDKRIEPASLTKLMTIYVTFQQIKQGQLALEDRVLISKKAWKMEGSRMFAEVGDKISILKMLKGIIVQSGNDASVAVAEHIAGSEDAFADMMNATAKSLGMKNSHFMNATGLPAENHYSSASDIALLSSRIINDFPDYYVWFSITKFKHNGIEQFNRNKLLYRNIGVDGLKTGHTEAAGYCLAATSKKAGMRLIAVVAGAESDIARSDQAATLLEFGHLHYKPVSVDNAQAKPLRVYGGVVDSVPLRLAKKVTVIQPKQSDLDFQYRYELPLGVTAPLAEDQIIAMAELMYNDQVILEQPLMISEEVQKGSIFKRGIDSIKILVDGF